MTQRTDGPVVTTSTPGGPGRPLPLAGALLCGAAVIDVVVSLGDLTTNQYASLSREGVVLHDISGWLRAHLVVGVLLGLAGVVAPLGRIWSTWAALVAVALGVLADLVTGPFHPVQALMTTGLTLAAARLLVRYGRLRC
ncbi:hypothetical protein AWW66_11620 [Micromonospora rosaria]|uniref:DUF7144 domain-containing protein n=1 Tax=Micromonospora rosaria TaxID=47874 RepID=A0A136PUJ8_9ACTN|nr:hypothetical protein [Micromonospora rosaria]KXK61826.1 hypothetical protein AWW66_11620 [Micromonospora rosaria]